MGRKPVLLLTSAAPEEYLSFFTPASFDPPRPPFKYSLRGKGIAPQEIYDWHGLTNSRSCEAHFWGSLVRRVINPSQKILVGSSNGEPEKAGK